MHALLLRLLAATLVLGLCGCGESKPLWRAQKLPSGKVVQVMGFHLAWGSDHDVRLADQDCLSLEFVTAHAAAADVAREAEAREVFELIRPTAELWGFRSSTVIARAELVRRPKYELFVFRRPADDTWVVERQKL